MAEKKEQKEQKEYIITYKSMEHFEVLGWVRASSMEEAIKKAKKELVGEIKKYSVTDGEISEWDGINIKF